MHNYSNNQGVLHLIFFQQYGFSKEVITLTIICFNYLNFIFTDHTQLDYGDSFIRFIIYDNDYFFFYSNNLCQIMSFNFSIIIDFHQQFKYFLSIQQQIRHYHFLHKLKLFLRLDPSFCKFYHHNYYICQRYHSFYIY